MNNNFNANELDSTYGVIGELNTAFQLLGWAGAGSAKPASDLYNKIASEDSKLATTWKHSGEISGEISKKANKLLEGLKTEIQNYAKATVQNEQQAAQEIEGINASLSDQRTQLEQIEV